MVQACPPQGYVHGSMGLNTWQLAPSLRLSLLTPTESSNSLTQLTMAAYAALVSLAEATDLLLDSGKYSISVGEKAKITSIREYVMFLTSFLEDFPEKSSRLEAKIRDLANETGVILEEFMWKHNRLSWWSTIGLSRFEFEEQLRKVTVEIGLIVGEIMDERSVGDSSAAASSSESAHTIENDVVIGLYEDVKVLKDRLCGLSSKLQFIPIVGMGGIGKTTLARMVYNDSLIVGHFHIRAWVTISQDYSARRVLSGLLGSMNLFPEMQVFGEDTKKDILVEKLYKTFKGRRYLVVIDDVWSTNVWDDLRRVFPDDENESRVVLTTRLSDVGVYPDPYSPLHRMRFMSFSHSWDLLKRKVFVDGQDCPSELEEIGKWIARSCRGLPLAIVLVGGILSVSKMTQALWEEIAENIASHFDGQLEKILSMSYKHLPQHLRPCFLFIGGFQEYYEIHVQRLIKLWVAEGFLRPDDKCKSLEDKAEKYLEDLVQRNLVLVVRRKTNGKIKSCTLHDLVQEMCMRKANEEKFILHVRKGHASTEITKGFRCINLVDCDLKEIWCQTIRSIIGATSEELDLVANFRLLRVLDMTYDHERVMPSQVFELIHLRFLAFGYFVRIPSSISNLKNLQTLIICPRVRYSSHTTQMPSLPLEIWSMPKLKHLVFSYAYVLPEPDNGALCLENLLTLSGVANLICSERILKLIPNLKKLGTSYYVNEEYDLHNLVHLCQLEKLKLSRFRNSSWLGQNPMFPLTLKKLALNGGEFPWKEMSVVGALPNLGLLKLRFLVYDGDTWETKGGQFLQLKFLLIEETNLQHWVTEASHFPRLESLVLRRCRDLSQIPAAIGEISTLELIEVDDVNKSLVDSAKKIQEDQLENYGNNALQVRCTHFYESGVRGQEKEPEIAPWLKRPINQTITLARRRKRGTEINKVLLSGSSGDDSVVNDDSAWNDDPAWSDDPYPFYGFEQSKSDSKPPIEPASIDGLLLQKIYADMKRKLPHQ